MSTTPATDTPAEAPAATGTTGAPGTVTVDVELAIGGMTCASCAARIEKKLNRMDGVEATVNYATEKAKVTYAQGDLSVQDLIATVEKTGYTAAEPPRPCRRAAAARSRDPAPAPVRRAGPPAPTTNCARCGSG